MHSIPVSGYDNDKLLEIVLNRIEDCTATQIMVVIDTEINAEIDNFTGVYRNHNKAIQKSMNW